jgi:hypothetical protein
VETEERLFDVRLARGTARRLIVNGRAQAYRIDGEYLIPSDPAGPFLELLVPADSVLSAGMRQKLSVRIWNPTDQAIRHALQISPAPDWGERVRRQLEWWGGVVNLLPLNKGSIQRRLIPESRLDASVFTRLVDSIEVAPGSSRIVEVAIDVPPDTPPVRHPLLVSFGPCSLATTLAVTPPFRPRVFVPTGSALMLRVALQSEHDANLSVRIHITDSPGWLFGKPPDTTVVLPGNGTAQVDFPCRFVASNEPSQHFPVRVALSAGEYTEELERDFYVTVAAPTHSPPSLDGSWAGWSEAAPATIDSSNQISKLLLGNQPWLGPKDLSARVRVLYDSIFLYVGADVTDDSVVTHWEFPAMSYPWDTDCMEVVLDTRRGAAQGDDPPTPGLFRHLSLAEHRVTRFPADRWRGGGAGGPLLPAPLLVPGAETFFARSATGYAIMCRYPIASLQGLQPGPGFVLGFDVAFSDNDGTTYRKNQHIWAGYGQNQSWWDMQTIGLLIFGASDTK